MIFDHIGFGVRDYELSKAFFSKALAPLGIVLIAETHGWAGYGTNGKPELWFGAGQEPQRPMHLAFLAANREQVRGFYSAAIEAGGTDNGPPGLRPHYHQNYYGAFVIGPDGTTWKLSATPLSPNPSFERMASPPLNSNVRLHHLHPNSESRFKTCYSCLSGVCFLALGLYQRRTNNISIS